MIIVSEASLLSDEYPETVIWNLNLNQCNPSTFELYKHARSKVLRRVKSSEFC